MGKYRVEVAVHDNEGNILTDVMMLDDGKIQQTMTDYDADLLVAAIRGAQKTRDLLGDD